MGFHSRIAPPPPPDPTRALHKSLRLPRAHSKVARWLFADSHLPFHREAPLLTPHAFSTSFALRIHHSYNDIGPMFDPFGVEDSQPPSVTSAETGPEIGAVSSSAASTASELASQTLQSATMEMSSPASNSPSPSPSPQVQQHRQHQKQNQYQHKLHMSQHQYPSSSSSGSSSASLHDGRTSSSAINTPQWHERFRDRNSQQNNQRKPVSSSQPREYNQHVNASRSAPSMSSSPSPSRHPPPPNPPTSSSYQASHSTYSPPQASPIYTTPQSNSPPISSIYPPAQSHPHQHQMFSGLQNTRSQGVVAPSNHASISIELLLTPVALATPTVIVGYTLTTGQSFNPQLTPMQSGTFRGKAHLNGRFAYDVENDHFLMAINAVTPLVTGIMDFTFTGASRDRFFYTVPCAPYGPHRLPSRVLAMMTNTEVKVTTPPSNIFLTPELRSYMKGPTGSSDCVPTPDAVSAIYGDAPRAAATGVPNLVDGMRSLANHMQGLFEGPYLRRDVYDPMNSNRVISRLTGVVTGFKAAPTAAHRRTMVLYGWQEYCAWAYGLRTQHRAAGLISAAAPWPGSDGADNVAKGRRSVAIQTDAMSDDDTTPVCKCSSNDSNDQIEEEIDIGDDLDNPVAPVAITGQLGLSRSVGVNPPTVQERQPCYACNGLVGRTGVTLIDDEQMRVQKLESKREKNRQSAIRSNLRRKKREENQRIELVCNKRRATELGVRRNVLEAENEQLRQNIERNGLLVPTHLQKS